MKLQIKFTVDTPENGEKKVSKTFSNVNQAATNEDFISFSSTYTDLCSGQNLEVYLIKVEDLMGGSDDN